MKTKSSSSKPNLIQSYPRFVLLPSQQKQQQENMQSKTKPTEPTKEPKSVSFGTVHVRVHERTVGDNPSCSSGVPVSIGWGSKDISPKPVDVVENAREPMRRPKEEFVLCRQTRRNMLLEWEVPMGAIVNSIRNCERVKRQRRTTVNNIGSYDRVEEAMEEMSRIMKRALLGGFIKEDLWDQEQITPMFLSPSSKARTVPCVSLARAG
jgi:hypothetical protein